MLTPHNRSGRGRVNKKLPQLTLRSRLAGYAPRCTSTLEGGKASPALLCIDTSGRVCPHRTCNQCDLLQANGTRYITCGGRGGGDGSEVESGNDATAIVTKRADHRRRHPHWRRQVAPASFVGAHPNRRRWAQKESRRCFSGSIASLNACATYRRWDGGGGGRASWLCDIGGRHAPACWELDRQLKTYFVK